MTSIILGFLAFALGVFGMVHWFSDLLDILRGLLPLSLASAGLIAIFAGISSLRKP